MKTNALLAVFLTLCIAPTASLLPLTSADSLTTTDFTAKSWSKTVDYFNYLRLQAAFQGKPLPPWGWHAWTYMTYINTTGLQLLYCGLQNITLGSISFTTPIQTVLMHYKTENTSTDVVTASSFLMLMAFQDNETMVNVPNSPDLSDTLFASLSFGIDLTSWFEGQPPTGLNSKTETFPLEGSDDGTHWSWGMKYTNMTALWYRTYIDPNDPYYAYKAVAVTKYDELTFTYNLTINKDTHKATLTENHIIGRMRDLYFWDIVDYWPALLHYNSTGCYRTFLGTKLEGYPNIYEWLNQNKIKMSIIQYQTTMMINHSTINKSGAQNVTDNDVNVSNTDISTTSDTGEKIFDASFGTKKTYRLYNYTTAHNETIYNTYDAVARTCKIRGFAFNAVVSNCTAFLRYVPYVLKHIHEPSYNQGQTLLLNVTGANYFYIISYPTYSGYRIEHDPTYTYYMAPVEGSPSQPQGLGGIVVLAIVTIAIVLIVGIVIRRRKHSAQPQLEQ